MGYSVVADWLFDPVQAEPQGACTVHVDGDRISAVVAGHAPRRDDTVVDLGGLCVLPGLINAHSHLGDVPMLAGDELAAGVVAAWIFEHCRRSLDLGITTCRDVGSLDGGVVAAIEQGIARGPRILPAGPVLVQTGGHGEFRPPFAPDPAAYHRGVPGLSVPSLVVDGPDQMRAAARLAFKRGARFLKLCVTGGVTSITDALDDTQFTVDEIRAAVEEAKARHTYVTVHAHNNDGVRNALRAGVECFEHVTALDEETAGALSRAGAAVVPTLTVAHLYRENAAFLPPDILDRIEGVEAGMRNAIRVAHEAGLLVGCGADLIGPDQRRFGLEVALVAEVVGAAEALRTATLGNARVLRMERDLGGIEAGKLADIAAVDGDPLADPRLLDDPARVRFVMKAGVVEKDRRG